MAKGTIGGRIVLEGESKYRAAIKNIKTEQTELRSEMRLCQSTFKDNQNSLEALQTKYGILEKQVDSQTRKVEIYQKAMLESSEKEQEAAQKVEELQNALDKAQKEMQDMESCTGATADALEKQSKSIEELKEKLSLAEQNYDKATQKTMGYQSSVNNAKAELQGMQNELTKVEKYLDEAANNTDKCAKSIDEYGKEVKKASEETINFGDIFKANIASGIVEAGFNKIIELSKKAGEELVNCAIGAAQYADEVMTTSTNTGIAAETLQELMYAQELMDVSLETLTGTMAKNIKSMDAAEKGSEDYVEAYKKLGVSITDIEGRFRDSETVFWEVIDALGKMKNETERDATAMQLFGKKAQDINSLIAIGSEGFKELAAEAHETGYVLSDEVLDGLLDTSDAMERMNNRVTATKNRIGAELAPVFTKAFDKIADVVEDAEDDITEFATGAIPKLIEGFEWIIDNADYIVAGIGGIAAISFYHSTITPALEMVTKAWKAYKVASDNATLSQNALNTAMSLNPIGLVVTAVVGLTAALASYNAMNKGVVEATDKVTKATYEQAEAAKQLNEAYKESSEERKSARSEYESNAEASKKLVAELNELQKKTTLTADEQVRQKMIVEQLNTSMPKLNLAINDQTGKLNMSTKALYDNIDAMLRLDKAEAAREDMKIIAQEQWEAEKQLTDMRLQLEEQTKKVTEAEAEYNQALDKTDNGHDGDSRLLKQGDAELARLNLAKQGQEELEAQIKETEESIASMGEEYSECLDFISETESINEAANATDNLGNAAASTGSAFENMSVQAREAYEEMYTSLSETVNNQISLFEEFNGKAELSTSELLSNMQSQVEGLTSWSDNIALLAEKGINQGLLQHLANMGPAGAGYVATFVNMTDEELKKANELFNKSMTIPDEAVDEVMQAYLTAGEGAGKSLQTGISSSKEPVTTAAKEVVEEALDASKETLGTNSQSGETEKIGEQFDSGLESGIENGKSDVITTVTDLSSDITTTAKEELKTTTFEEIGKQITSGIKKGIDDGKSGVIESLKKMCTELISATNEELDITPTDSNVESDKKGMANTSAVIQQSLPDTAMLKQSESGSVTELSSQSESIIQNVLNDVNARYESFVAEAVDKISTTIKVILEGDAKRVFDLVKVENDKQIKATGYNKLARREEL